MSPAVRPEPVLDDDDDDPALAFTRPAKGTKPKPEQAKPEPPKSRSSGRPRPRGRAGTSDLPRYRQAERKDALLWPEQITELHNLSKALMRAREHKSERITENTLLRIAVDYLLQHADRLHGDTEDELRAALLEEDQADEHKASRAGRSRHRSTA